MISRALFLLIALLAAPTLAFCLLCMQPGPGGIAALAFAAATLGAFAGRVDWRAPAEAGRTAACLLIGLALALIAGGGHFFYQTDDWTMRDAVLLDLIRNPWPVPYMWDGHAPLTMLRAPLGMYLTPALVGKALGERAGDLAMLAQNGLMFGLLLRVFMDQADSRRAGWIAAAFFVLFSGVDIIPWALLRMQGASIAMMPHIEVWTGRFQYSSHVTEMLWSPNHALPGWCFVAAYEAWRRGKAPATALAVVFAACVLWSPLAALGAFPFLILAGLRDLSERRLSMRGLVEAALAAISVVPVAIYLTRDAGAVSQRWLFGEDGFVLSYLMFIAFELGAFVGLLARDPVTRETKGWERAEILLILAVLALIPFYLIGDANDFAMRVSIPALALLALRAASAFDRAWRFDRLANQRWVLAALALAVVTPLSEIGRNLVFAPSAMSPCNVVEAFKAGPATTLGPDGQAVLYVADAQAFEKLSWLFRLPASTPEKRVRPTCFPLTRRFVFSDP